MASVCGELDAGGKDPGRALLLAWLLPGAGHWFIGLRWRGLLYGASVIGILVAGILMGGLATVSAYDHKWAFLLQVFDGPLALAAGVVEHLARPAATAPDAAAWLKRLVAPAPSPLTDLGMTFTLASAAFNVLVMADAFYLADRPAEAPAQAAPDEDRPQP
ncbi:MAG: hypothetical protein FJ291_25855 [Planctomycetes bacterium]|nr:hypothetical protein [Planctomycetota bacterium]